MASNRDFGDGPLAMIDRGCWLALSQGEPRTWSWPKAIATIAIGLVIGGVIYATEFSEPAFIAGLVLVYALVLWRARSAYERSVAPR